MTKTYIAISLLSIIIFQFILFYLGITLRHTTGLWLVSTIAFNQVIPFIAHPLDDWIHFQITFRKERIQNRKQYELFKSGVKDGLFTTDEQVERENRRIVK